ncbi:MAG: anthranilate phosphoribosyltransferase [Verrucomicrobia bacterium]|jgi:anthranilate phosphoribosyltransferase|nr:anthranilate phosphoribosyltransferase [Verrucomicrobiota bacterium]
MREVEQLTKALNEGVDLSQPQAARAAEILADSSLEIGKKSDLLIALADKGESATEVAAFAATFRDLAVDPGVEAWAAHAIDVCGTGGDGAQTFNISTAVSFIVAAAGVPVFKHGNRSITSKCGSADLLEALGFDLQASLETQKASLEMLNFCFFFAPAYHPAFKEIMPVRKALAADGRRSIFNLLGPLINPGKPAHQLLGVFSVRWVEPLAKALDALGLKSGLVAHGSPTPGQGLDELSCAGKNHLAGFGRLRGQSSFPSLGDLSLSPCDLQSLEGGGVAENLRILRALVEGDRSRINPGLRDSILLNAGAALWIADKSDSLASGVNAAREVIDSGRLKNWMQRAQSFYCDA